MRVQQFFRFLAGLHGGVRRGRIEGLADRLELERHRRLEDLSAEERQKVALVQALMHEAPLVLLDEPGTGLDALGKTTLLDLLWEERTAGRTVLLATRRLSQVERLCDRVAVLRGGRLVALETVQALKTRRVRQLSILFGRPVDPRSFESDGIVVLDRGDRRIRLAVRGDLNPLIRALAGYDVQDLTIGEPDLEEVLLQVSPGASRPAVPV